ncbi:MAG: CBS domain-containing protein [Marinilabiliales bacterium]|nr:MAG: CBS domain-containing protein [Marinilabiliales bacterium]
MFASDYIEELVPVIKTSTTAAEALSLMEEFKITHLAIVNNKEFLGLLSENDLLSLDNYDEAVGGIKIALSNVFVKAEDHIFDILKSIDDNKLSLLPVVSKNNVYEGSILARSLVSEMATLLSVNNPGGIIILEVNLNDYVMSQIASIVESNDALIIASYVKTDAVSTKMDVVLKVNKTDIGGIIQTFNRFEYIVKASFGEEEKDDFLRDRYDSLMNYLNI